MVVAVSDGLRALVCHAAQGKESGRVQRRASRYASRQRVSSGAEPCARRDQDTTSAEGDSTLAMSRMRASIPSGVPYGASTNPQSAWRTVTLYEVAPAGMGTQKTARLPAGTSAGT
jgi:hypothetical protein